MTVGSVLGGRFADRNAFRTMIACLTGLVIALGALTFAASVAWAAVALLFAVGMFSLALGPAVQTRLLEQAGDAPALVSAGLHSGANLANSLGAWLGGLVIAGGLGLRAPNVVGAALVGGGLALLLTGAAFERKGRAERPATVTGDPASTQNTGNRSAAPATGDLSRP
jgi:DHA1 family inner membrane transport protein